MASVTARVARLEQRQQADVMTPYRVSLEWWKWKTARHTSAIYAPDLPPGVGIEELDAQEREREAVYLTTPDGQRWQRTASAACAQIDAMGEPPAC